MENPKQHFSGLSNKEAWKLRRRVLYLVLIFTAFLILRMFLYIPKDDITVHHVQVIQSLITLDGFLLLYWFFGSVVEDTLPLTNWGKK